MLATMQFPASVGPKVDRSSFGVRLGRTRKSGRVSSGYRHHAVPSVEVPP